MFYTLFFSFAFSVGTVLDTLLYELEGSSLHRRSDYYTLAFFWFSAPPPVTLQTKLNTTFLSLNEVGQHSVDIYLKSGLGDVGNEVFADDDVVKEGDIVINNKTIASGKSSWMKIDLGQILIYFWIHHTFLVISEKVGQTFLSTISQSLKDGSLLMKGIRR